MNGYEMQSAETVRSVEEITQEILFYKSQAGLAILEIGKRLIEAKAQLSHGEWEQWLEERVEFSSRTARRFMRLAEGYDKTDTGVLFLGVRKALALLALPEEEREEFTSERHEVDGEEKSVEEMTSAELERVLRERDEARHHAEELDGTVRTLSEERDAAEQRAEESRQALAAAQESATRAEQERQRLARELKAMKARPVEIAVERVVDEEAITAARAEAEKAAEEKLRAAEQEAETLRAQCDAANAEAERARQTAEELRRRAAAADGAVATFRLLFEQWQERFEELAERLDEISRSDPETGERLRAAVRAAAEGMGA